MKNPIKTAFKVLAITILSIVSFSNRAFAAENLYTVTPMYQKISLVPGERTYGTFKVSNPSSSTASFAYETRVEPFMVDEDNNPVYENNGDYNQIVNWITIINGEGAIAPNSTDEIEFYIDAPEEAPAGGQYAAIIVGPKKNDEGTEGVTIKTNVETAHLIYADVAGETIRKGEVNSVSVPSFLFSGKITGTASITNTGNVHAYATHTFQVFPLFSNEEVYTNEENPQTNMILPDATRSTSISWDETPSIGIFHVLYNVEFEGVKNSVDKYVIICPLWLLFLIILAIFLIIFRILSAKKKSHPEK